MYKKRLALEDSLELMVKSVQSQIDGTGKNSIPTDTNANTNTNANVISPPSSFGRELFDATPVSGGDSSLHSSDELCDKLNANAANTPIINRNSASATAEIDGSPRLRASMQKIRNSILNGIGVTNKIDSDDNKSVTAVNRKSASPSLINNNNNGNGKVATVAHNPTDAAATFTPIRVRLNSFVTEFPVTPVFDVPVENMSSILTWESKVNALRNDSMQCHYASQTKNFKNIVKQVGWKSFFSSSFS